MFMQKYTYIGWIHTDAMINDGERLLYKNIYLSLYCKGSKRVNQDLHVRGSWRPNITEISLTPKLWSATLCLSRSPLDLNLIRAPESPFSRVWLSLPHLTPTGTRTQLSFFCSIRRPYITFKLPRGDMDTPPRLCNFFRYLAIWICHFRYFWNGLCDRHRAEITVMQFRGHSLPVRQSMRV